MWICFFPSIRIPEVFSGCSELLRCSDMMQLVAYLLGQSITKHLYIPSQYIECHHKRLYNVSCTRVILKHEPREPGPKVRTCLLLRRQAPVPGPAIGWVSAGGVERVIVLNQHGCVTLANITPATQSPPQCERRSRCFRTQRERRTPRCAAHDICRRETLRLIEAVLVYLGCERQCAALREFVQPYNVCCLD